MKYLAILGDSVREAIDSKVFYVMVALSCVTIALVGGTSFKPMAADRGMGFIISQFPGTGTFALQNNASVMYNVFDLQHSGPPARPWQGTYHFLLTTQDDPSTPGAFRLLAAMTALQGDDPDRPEDTQLREDLREFKDQAQTLSPEQLKRWVYRLGARIQKMSPGQMERFVRSQLAAYGALDATRVHLTSEGPAKAEFVIDAQATPATFRAWPHDVSLFYGAYPDAFSWPLGPTVYRIETLVVATTGAAIAMLISTIITALFIPNMLRKGTVDLLLVKPLHRTTLLVYKYVGGLAFMFLNAAFVVAGIWLVLGLRSGLWGPGFLVTIFILTFEFALFYAVSTLFGVLTRSPLVAILAACLTWVVLFVVGLSYQYTELRRVTNSDTPRWVYAASETVHFVLPRYKDLDVLNGQVIARDLLWPEQPDRRLAAQLFASISWGGALGTSAAFIVVLLGLACWRFAARDY